MTWNVVILTLIRWIYGQYPILYLPPTDNETRVEDADAGRLFQGRAAFHLFAENAKNGGHSGKCLKHLHVFARNTTVSMLLSWIDETQNFTQHPIDATITISDLADEKFESPLVHKPVRIGLSALDIHFVLDDRRDAVMVTATVMNRTTCPLILSVDTTPPGVEIRSLIPFNQDHRDYLWISVRTTERTVPTRMIRENRCKEDWPTDAKNDSIHDLMDYRCPSISLDVPLTDIVNVTGGMNIVGRSLGKEAVLRIELHPHIQDDIFIRIERHQLSDFVGNLNNQSAELAYYHRPTVGRPSIDRHIRLLYRDVNIEPTRTAANHGALVGKVVTGVAGGTLTSSAASGGSSGHPGENLPIFLLNIVQKLYLSGNIAVADMPNLYSDFASQLSWAMFNFPSPFESFVTKGDKKKMVDATSPEQDLDGDDCYRRGIVGAYIYMSRVFFWVPLGLLCLLFFHVLVLLFCIWKRTRIPVIFAFPRLEILYLYWGMPAIAVASAGLFRGSKVDATIAVWLLVMLPGGMATWNLMTLHKFFYSKHPRHRHAHFVVQSTCLSTRSLEQLKADWQLRQKIKKEEAHPPTLFINGLYDDPNTIEQRHAQIWHPHEEPDSVNGSSLGEIREEIRHPLSDACPSSGSRDRIHDEHHCSPSHSRTHSFYKEISSASPSPDVQPYSTFRINSQGSSANNANYTTSGDDHSGVRIVHMRKMSDFYFPKVNGDLWDGAAVEKHLRLKYGTTDRFQNETSNNLVSLLARGVLYESGMSPLSSPPDTDRLDEGPSQWLNTTGAPSSVIEMMPRSESPEKPEWMRTTMVCSAIPEPAWNVFLSKEHQMKLPETVQEIDRSPSVKQRPDQLEVHRLSRISEISTGSASYLHQSMSRGGRSSRSHRGGFAVRPNFVDNQLGITVMSPEPFVETAARLKHINNECLLDMGLDYLIPHESSSDEDKSEVEYQQMMHQSLEETPKPSCWGIFKDLFDLGIFSVFMGGRQLKGEWMLSPYHDNNFISSYGYLFEDYHGLPVFYCEPTYEIRNGKMDRGKFIPLREPPLFQLPRWRIPYTSIDVPEWTFHRHHIQILTRFLLLMKIVFLGAMVSGVGLGRNSIGQIVVLFIASLLLLIALRIGRPYPTRFEMMIGMMEETSDAIFLSLALLLLLGPQTDDFRLQIGIGMIAVECSSFVAIITDRLIHCTTGFGVMLKRRRARKPTALTHLFFRYLSKNAYFLQRKYFDRWMVKTLKRGLYNRRPYRTELSLSYLLSCEIRKIKGAMEWCREECRLVWSDTRNRISSLGSPIPRIQRQR